MLAFLSISPEQRPCAAVLRPISMLDFPSLIISVFMLSQHQPGTSCSRAVNSSSDWSSQGRPAGKSLLDQAPLLQGQGSPVHARLGSGVADPLRTRLGSTAWTGSNTGAQQSALSRAAQPSTLKRAPAASERQIWGSQRHPWRWTNVFVGKDLFASAKKQTPQCDH